MNVSLTDEEKLENSREGANLVYDYCKKHIVGQDEILEEMIILFTLYMLDPEMKFSAYLVTGPSGCGKTHSIRTLCSALGLPFYEIDTTILSQASYKGINLSEILDPMIASLLSQQSTLKYAKNGTIYGVVFFDEFMKKFLLNDSNNSTIALAYEFLKLLEPGYEYNGHKLNLQFILADAMASLSNEKITKPLLVQKNIPPELIARIGFLPPFKKLTLEDCEKILRMGTGRVETRINKSKMIGLNFSLSDSAYFEIANLSGSDMFGARNINENVDKLFNSLIRYYVFGTKEKVNGEIIIDGDMVRKYLDNGINKEINTEKEPEKIEPPKIETTDIPETNKIEEQKVVNSDDFSKVSIKELDYLLYKTNLLIKQVDADILLHSTTPGDSESFYETFGVMQQFKSKRKELVEVSNTLQKWINDVKQNNGNPLYFEKYSSYYELIERSPFRNVVADKEEETFVPKEEVPKEQKTGHNSHYETKSKSEEKCTTIDEVLLKTKYPHLFNEAFENIDREIDDVNESIEEYVMKYYDTVDTINQFYSTTYDLKVEIIDFLNTKSKEINQVDNILDPEVLESYKEDLNEILSTITDILKNGETFIKTYETDVSISYLIPNLETQSKEINHLRKRTLKTIKRLDKKITDGKEAFDDIDTYTMLYMDVYDKTNEIKNTFFKCKSSLKKEINDEKINSRLFNSSLNSLKRILETNDILINETLENITFCKKSKISHMCNHLDLQLKELENLKININKYLSEVGLEYGRISNKQYDEYLEPFCNMAEKERNEIISNYYSDFEGRFNDYKSNIGNVNIDGLVLEIDKVIKEYKEDYYVGKTILNFEKLYYKILESKESYKEINEIKNVYSNVVERINKYKNMVHKYVAKEIHNYNLLLLDKVSLSLINNHRLEMPSLVINSSSDFEVNHLHYSLGREYEFVEKVYDDTIKMSKDKSFDVCMDVAKFAMEIQMTLNEIDSFKNDISNLKGSCVPDNSFLDIYFSWMIEQCPSTSLYCSYKNTEIIKYNNEWKRNIEFNMLKLITNGTLEKPERYYEPLFEYLENNNAVSTIEAISLNEKVNSEAREKAKELSMKFKKAENVKKYENRVKNTIKKRINLG